MFEIEKDIPIPNGKTAFSFPFEQLNVGESFSILPASVDRVRRERTKYREQAPEKTFIIRRIGDAYRCWRVR